MRTLTFAALITSLTATTMPAEAQRIAGRSSSTSNISSVQRSGSWSGQRQMQSQIQNTRVNTGNWNGPRNGGNWNATRPNTGNWNKPRPNGGNWNNNPRPGNWNNGHRPSRWGNKVGGHWYAGHNAPGGWNGYQRPYRGWSMPSYWVSPSYYINDWQTYGLSQPGNGYTWSRYYDDAVLLDNRGRVYDSVNNVDWDRYDDGYSYDDGYAYAQGGGGGYVQQGYVDQGYDQGYDDRTYVDRGYERRDSGLGGAAIGAGVGGVAGALIGGSVGGALIGAGVGAVGGYAVDKLEDRGRSRGYGAGYAQPRVVYGRSGEVVQGGGYAQRGYVQQGYAPGGYYYPPATTTTITVGAPVETVTTTTEYIEESTSYRKAKKWTPAPKKKIWRAPRAQCRC